MGFREFTNKRPYLPLGVITILAVATVAFAIIKIKRARSSIALFPTQAFYTCDDGATLFSDAVERLPPFGRDGKMAVRAHVFTCDGGAHRWIQYLEKYTDESLVLMRGPPTNQPIAVLVKKPGSGSWVARSTAAGLSMIVPRCPDGSDSKNIEPVNP